MPHYPLPDLGAYDAWSAKAILLRKAMPGTSFIESDMLESKATDADRVMGLDVADVLG